MTWPIWEKQVASAVQSVPFTWNAGIGNGEIPTWNGSERAERARLLQGQCTTCYAKVGNRRQLQWACAHDTTTALRPGHSSRATGA